MFIIDSSQNSKYENQGDIEPLVSGSFLSGYTFIVSVSELVSYLAMQYTKHVHTCVPWTCLCVFYMNKEEELGVVGGASERRANGSTSGPF